MSNTIIRNSSHFKSKIDLTKSKISSHKQKVTDKKGTWDQQDHEKLIDYHQQEKKLEKLESKIDGSKSLAEQTKERLTAYSDEIQTVLAFPNIQSNHQDALKELTSITTKTMVADAINKVKEGKPSQEVFSRLKVDLEIRKYQLELKQKSSDDFNHAKTEFSQLTDTAGEIKTALTKMSSFSKTSTLQTQIDNLKLNQLTLPPSFPATNPVSQKVTELKGEIGTLMTGASKAKRFNYTQTLQAIIDKVQELSDLLEKVRTQINTVFTKPHLDLTLRKEEVTTTLNLKKSELETKKTELADAIVNSGGTDEDMIDQLTAEKINLEDEISALKELQKKYHGSASQIYEEQVKKWETGKYASLMGSLVPDLKPKSTLKDDQNTVVEEFKWQETSSKATFNKADHFASYTTFKTSNNIEELIQKTKSRASKKELNGATTARLGARLKELQQIKANMEEAGSRLLGYVGWAGDKPTTEEQNAKLSQIQVLVFTKADGTLEFKYLQEVAAKKDLFNDDGTEKKDFSTDEKKTSFLRHLNVGPFPEGRSSDDQIINQGLAALREEARAAQTAGGEAPPPQADGGGGEEEDARGIPRSRRDAVDYSTRMGHPEHFDPEYRPVSRPQGGRPPRSPAARRLGGGLGQGRGGWDSVEGGGDFGGGGFGWFGGGFGAGPGGAARMRGPAGDVGPGTWDGAAVPRRDDAGGSGPDATI